MCLMQMKVGYKIKVLATGEEQTFDTLEECRDWANLVQKTFCDWSMKFQVQKTTTEEIEFKL